MKTEESIKAGGARCVFPWMHEADVVESEPG